MANPQKPDAFEDFLKLYGPPAGEDGPVDFVRNVLGAEPDEWQAEVLRAYGRGERRIAIRSCHGPGKTACASWCIVYTLLTRYPQKTVATAPTSSQLEGALIPEVKTWINKLPPALQQLFEQKAKGIYLEAAPNESFFEARTSRAEKPEALQGVHSEHVLLVADEASGVPEQVFEAAAGSMSGHNATTLLIGNPVRTSGLFYDVFHKLSDMWYTMHVSHEDSPRVSDDFVRDLARRYGEDSNAFRIRCLGEFPRSDEDTVIPFELVESAQSRDIEVPNSLDCVWGLDVARFGDDRNALVQRTKMDVQVLDIWQAYDLMKTAGRVKSRWDETQPHDRPTVILVDVVGLGGGVVDRLRELGLPVRGINVGEAAALNEKYNRARSELWWKAREWLQKRDVVLPTPDPKRDPREDPADILATELVVPTYDFTSTGKIDVESKAEIKKRGYNSPDVADAFILTFAEDLSAAMYGSDGGRMTWNQPIKRNLPGVV